MARTSGASRNGTLLSSDAANGWIGVTILHTVVHIGPRAHDSLNILRNIDPSARPIVKLLGDSVSHTIDRSGVVMEPIITIALLVGALHKVIDSAASEAGPRLWGMLTDLVRRHRVGTEQPSEAQEAPPVVEVPRNESEIDVLARHLAQLAANDPEFAAGLRTWLKFADDVGSASSNTISGTVHGNAVQARDIGGPITFN